MGLADFGNNIVVIRQQMSAGVDFNGVAPGTTPAYLASGRKLIYPADAANGGLFDDFEEDWSYTLWGIRINVPGATRYDVWIRNEAGNLFLFDQNIGWGGSAALENLRVHLTAGDHVVVATQGATGPGVGVAELVFDLWGPAILPY